MAKAPRAQQETDAKRIGQTGPGKLDADTEQPTEEERRQAAERRAENTR